MSVPGYAPEPTEEIPRPEPAVTLPDLPGADDGSDPGADGGSTPPRLHRSPGTGDDAEAGLKESDVYDFGVTQRRVRERILLKKGDHNFHLSRMSKEHVYDNYWTDSSLGLLEDRLNKCEQAADKHTIAAVRARRRNIQVTFPSIVLGAAASGLAFFAVGEDHTEAEDLRSSAVSIAIAVLTSAVSVIGGLTGLFSLSERQSQHIAAVASFTNLARKIQVCIFLPMELRSQCEVVLTDVSGEFTSLVTTSPVIYDLC